MARLLLEVPEDVRRHVDGVDLAVSGDRSGEATREIAGPRTDVRDDVSVLERERPDDFVRLLPRLPLGALPGLDPVLQRPVLGPRRQPFLALRRGMCARRQDQEDRRRVDRNVHE